MRLFDNEREPVNSKQRNQRLSTDRERYPYFGATGQVGEIDSYRSEGVSILLGEDGAPFLDRSRSKAYLVSGKYWVNNHAHILRGKPGVDNRFVCYQLNAVDYSPHVSGSTRLKLTQGAMGDINLVVAPPQEQVRIADKIDELFSSIDEGERALERVRKLVERYRQSVLKAAVTGELTREWREQHSGEFESGEALLTHILEARRQAWENSELVKMEADKKHPSGTRWKQRYKRPKTIDSSGLVNLPDGWVWSSMGQVGSVTGGLTKNQGRKVRTFKRPYLRVANVYANRLDLEEIAEIGVSEAELDRVLLKDNDLLIVEGNGSIAQVGRVALWGGGIDGCVHQNHIIKVRFPCLAMAWYALVWCLSPPGRALIEQVASSTSGLHTLSITKIESLPIPIPSMEELALIRDQFEGMTSLVVSQQFDLVKSVQKAAGLRRSVLRAAFLGALVTQDDADGPASALLERIAAKRSTTGPEALATTSKGVYVDSPRITTSSASTAKIRIARKDKAKA